MRWLEKIRHWWQDSVQLGGSAADVRLPGPAARTPNPSVASRGRRAVQPAARSSQEALSGYGNNPYDTYTWELHTADDGERGLKRTADISRNKSREGDKNNPYDTGTFNSPW